MSERTYWRSPELGEPRELELPGGVVRCFEAGEGPAIVFVHGFLVNANLWRKVVSRLSGSFRCVTLDMPLGAHELPMPNADLSPIGLADLVGDAIQALELEDVTLVGNDTGGGISQIAIDRRSDRIGRVVLTSCDAYENFPPRFFKVILAPLAVPASVPVLFGALRIRALRSTPLAFGWLMRSKLDPEAGDSYVLPILANRELRADASRVWGSIDPRTLVDAASRFDRFERPVLIAWSKEDRFFPPEDAERLARDFADARLEWIEDSYTFSPEDQPERLAELIGDFAGRQVKVDR